MAKQKAVESLRESIRLLEIRQEKEGKELKAQFKITYESLKPSNLIKNSLKELTSSSELKGNFFDAVTTLLTGFLARSFFVGSKKSVFRKLLGLVMEFGLTNLVARNTELIRDFFTSVVDKFLKPAPEKTTTPEA